MSIKINWNKLRSVHKDLIENGGLQAETEVSFLMMLADGTAKKAVVQFKNFLQCFWAISEDPNFRVTTLVVQDKEGRVLYRHKQLNKCNEEIPDGGNISVIQHWEAFTPEEKETYIRMLIAQINGYGR